MAHDWEAEGGVRSSLIITCNPHDMSLKVEVPFDTCVLVPAIKPQHQLHSSWARSPQCGQKCGHVHRPTQGGRLWTVLGFWGR